MATTKKVVKIDTRMPTLRVHNGEVLEVEPEVIEEIEHEEVVADNGKPKHKIQTPHGEAVYEYVGDCRYCKEEGIEMPVFHCVSGNIRSDLEMGNQLAAFRNDGELIAMCQNHHNKIVGARPMKDKNVEYKVIERRW